MVALDVDDEVDDDEDDELDVELFAVAADGPDAVKRDAAG